MESMKVRKIYLAKVRGNFKEKLGEEAECKKHLYVLSYKDSTFACADEDQLTEEQKKTSKDAHTLFKFKSYDKDSDTSIVKYIF